MFNKNIINQTSHTFRPKSTLIGAGGTDIFTFKGISPGTTTLKLQYKRSWDKDFAEEKVFLIKVTRPSSG
jgi:predicted secreted protein